MISLRSKTSSKLMLYKQKTENLIEDKKQEQLQDKRKNRYTRTPNLSINRENDYKPVVNFGQFDKIQFTCNEDKYRVEKQIGCGSYADVFLGKNQKDQDVAIKIYNKLNMKRDLVQNVIKEIEIMKTLNHPRIVKLYDVYQTNGTINLVLEFCGNQSLYDMLKQQKKLSKYKALQILKQLLQVLNYMHHNNIAHRDIKLDNIIVERSSIKLIDLGLSNYSFKFDNLFCGTPSYMAPEIIKKQQYDLRKSDIWSTAVILITILQGFVPFKGRSERELFFKIKRGLCKIEIEDQDILRLVDKMLVSDPSQRCSAAQLLEDPLLK